MRTSTKRKPLPLIATAPFKPNKFSPVKADMPVNINVHIQCESDQEVLAHLSVIRATFKKRMKKMEGNPQWAFSDNNCYGTHYVQVNNEL